MTAQSSVNISNMDFPLVFNKTLCQSCNLPTEIMDPRISTISGSMHSFKQVLGLCDMSGPMVEAPFSHFNTSPLMTAVKKPDARRAVFDASFGDLSLNNNTPSDNYLGMPIEYAYPKIEDFKAFIIKLGRGCFIFTREICQDIFSRYH